MFNREAKNNEPNTEWLPFVSGRTIDQDIAETTPCPKCGGKCEYEADDSGGSYRAFAVCTKCNNRLEF